LRTASNGRHWHETALCYFYTRESRFAQQTSVAWRELRGEPLATLTRDSGIRLLVEVSYESAEVPLLPTYEVSQISTALALVRSELAIAVLPTYARAVAPEGVLAKPLTEPLIARDIVMIRASGRSMSPALTIFETLLRRFVRQSTPNKDD
jgi:DNA-binding transcriptional LysR family regulator